MCKHSGECRNPILRAEEDRRKDGGSEIVSACTHVQPAQERSRCPAKYCLCDTPSGPNPRGQPQPPRSATHPRVDAAKSEREREHKISWDRPLPSATVVEGWGTDRDVPKAWWYKTGNDGLYQSEMTVCTRSAALTRLNRVAAGPSALSRERSSPRQRGTSPQRRPTMHEKRAAQVRSRARKIRVSCMAMGKVDRRNRPPGGPILSHWGAEEEV
jgi:hypothetical protein